jgi:hypothetical protein
MPEVGTASLEKSKYLWLMSFMGTAGAPDIDDEYLGERSKARRAAGVPATPLIFLALLD